MQNVSVATASRSLKLSSLIHPYTKSRSKNSMPCCESNLEVVICRLKFFSNRSGIHWSYLPRLEQYSLSTPPSSPTLYVLVRFQRSPVGMAEVPNEFQCPQYLCCTLLAYSNGLLGAVSDQVLILSSQGSYAFLPMQSLISKNLAFKILLAFGFVDIWDVGTY